MGAFVHDHYFIKIITDSGGTYVFALLTAVALGHGLDSTTPFKFL